MTAPDWFASGRDVLEEFIARVVDDWEPAEGDTLSVSRVYDDKGNVVPGKRIYTLTLTMDAEDGD